MSEIKVNDYIRTKKDGIKQVFKIEYDEEHKDNWYCFNKSFDDYFSRVLEKDILNSNKDLLDLIEKGDVLEVYAPNTDNILKTSIKDNFKDTLIYNAVKNGNLKIKSILTKEQYEERSFKVGE